MASEYMMKISRIRLLTRSVEQLHKQLHKQTDGQRDREASKQTNGRFHYKVHSFSLSIRLYQSFIESLLYITSVDTHEFTITKRNNKQQTTNTKQNKTHIMDQI